MGIVAITICVNYDDILKHMLNQNSKFFDVWYIVTSAEDKNTQQLILKSGLKNVRLLLFDGFYKDAKFNKGGAICFAQSYIEKNHTNPVILILDADIYLPNDFLKKIPKEFDKNTLYGPKERLDYWKLEDFKNFKNPHVNKHGNDFIGCFQLYKQSSFKYEKSNNCAECDNVFREKFKKKLHLDLSIRHLGKGEVNWDGRKSKNDL
jgi:hypothetical protein